jgi:leader peptidase (prepilin peptidase)/N-methyltransferase
MPILIVFFALFGLVIGSFLTVLAHRLPSEEPFALDRSRCPDCGHQIAAYDNIPLVSWVLLRGRCRHCGEPISIRYPLSELALAAAFVGALLRFEGDAAAIALACVFSATLLTITLTDLEYRLIPNKVLIAGLVVGAAIAIPTDPDGLPERVIAAAAAFGVLFLVAVAYPRGMGMGDVKLAGLMGFYLGRAVAPALLIGFLVGALWGLALIARHGAEARKQAVPFGPFLALGGMIGLFAGDEIVDWYLDSFFEGS